MMYNGPEDDSAIDLVFNKKKADNRKMWLERHQPDDYVDHNEKNLSYEDFVNKVVVFLKIMAAPFHED